MSRSAQQPSPNLAELRNRAGLTPRRLAELAGVSTRTIQYAERGAVPHVGTQIRIVVALDRELDVDSPTYPRRLRHTDLWPLVDEEVAA